MLPVPGRAEAVAPDLAPGKRTLTEALPIEEPGSPAASTPASSGGGSGSHLSSATNAVTQIASASVTPSAPAGPHPRDSGAALATHGGTAAAWDYAEHTKAQIIASIADRIGHVGLVQPHARLRWLADQPAGAAVAAAIHTYVDAVPGLALKRMMMLAYPADLVQAVDQARNGRAGGGWMPEVGRAIAEAFDEPLVASIRRMGLRLRVQLDGDAHGAMPRGSSLVASCPLDGVIADVLVTPGVVTAQAAKPGAQDDTPDRPFAHGVREVEYQWLGVRDPELWNWIHVTAPKDATAEHVARTPLAGGEVIAGSEEAYRIAASPPYFGIPIETARRVPEAWKHAPVHLKTTAAADELGPRIADGSVLAGSAIADEAALTQAAPAATTALANPLAQAAPAANSDVANPHAQATPPAKTAPAGPHAQAVPPAKTAPASPHAQAAPAANSDVAGQRGLAGPAPRSDLTSEHALERAHVQLAYLKQKLAPWHAHLVLGAAQAFLLRRSDQQKRDPRAGQRWAPVLIAAERILYAAASETTALLDDLAQHGAMPGDAGALGPFVGVLEAYAHAAGVAHLAAEAPAALAAARRLRGLLPVALAEDRIRGARQAVAEQQHAQRDAGGVQDRAGDSIAAVPGLATRAADLRLRAARGEPVDRDAAAQLAVDADEVALRASITTFQTRLAILERRADEVKLSVENPGGWTVQRTTAHLRAEAAGWLAQLDRTHDLHRTYGSSTGPGSPRDRIDGARRTVATVHAEMASVKHKAEIGEFLQYAYDRIADQMVRDVVSSMALQIGIMIATGQVAGAAVAAVRGLMLAREVAVVGEMVLELRQVGLEYQALELVAQSYLMTRAQSAMGGASDASAFAENLAGMALTGAALRPFEGLFGDAATLERELQTWAGTARAGARLAVKAPTEVGVGIGAAGATHAAIHGGPPTAASADEVVTQGIALVASKFVHRHTIEIRKRIERAMSGADRAEAQALLRQVDALSLRAQAAGERTVEQARALLADHAAVLQRELRFYDIAATKPATDARAQAAADQSALGGTFVEASFRLAGLRPVVDGAIFEGTARQITGAFAAADQSGVPPKRTRDPQTGAWRVTSGDRTYEIRDRGGAPGDQADHGLPREADTSSRASDPAVKPAGRAEPGKPPASASKPVEAAESSPAAHAADPKRVPPPAPDLDEEADARGSGLPEFPIAIKQVSADVDERGHYFAVLFRGRTITGGDVRLGTGSVGVDEDGIPQGSPSFELTARYHHDRKDYAVKIYDDVAPAGGGGAPVGQGSRTALTEYALQKFIARYKAKFGSEPEEIFGILADSNKLHYQREYTKLVLGGIDEHTAAVEAARRISFGVHRIKAGYTAFEVAVGSPALVDLGTLGVHQVPTSIRVTVRRP
jgi:hypothetical protein